VGGEYNFFMNLPVKYRPKTFEEVTGQHIVTRTLQNALKHRKVSSAYLFTGPKGVGKTTIARLLAKGLNCEEGITPHPCNKCIVCREIDESRSLDVIEIDGASNRGIDEIRNLRENVRFMPSRGRYRVFIIDEVHMLTTEAFNALLKTLEEPPSHVIFIMATTDPRKIPETVISRTQRFDFKPLANHELKERVLYVAEREGIPIDGNAVDLLVRYSEGSMRDALALLEQLSIFTEKTITVDEVRQLLGVIPEEFYFKLIKSATKGDVKTLLKMTDDIFEEGYSPLEFVRGFQNSVESLLRAKSGIENNIFTQLSKEIPEEDIIGILKIALDMEESVKRTSRPRVYIDYHLVRLAYLPSAIEINEILEKSGVTFIGKDKERIEEDIVETDKRKGEKGIEKFLERIDESYPLLAGIISSNSFNLDNGSLMIKVRDSFQQELLERHKEKLEKLFEELYGEKVVIKIEEEKRDDPFNDDPIFRKMLELFDLEVIKDV
jgi:DNA polymerase-3 subunit gamma/tau